MKILIVEDECIFSMNLQFMLEDMGHEVTGLATHYYQAIDSAQKNMPDLALMDVYLKGELTGIDTEQGLRKIFGIPSIFITANNDTNIDKKLHDVMPLAIFSKPLDEERFREVIAKVAADFTRKETDTLLS
jgi:CheY-like chemotaxis protein